MQREATRLMQPLWIMRVPIRPQIVLEQTSHLLRDLVAHVEGCVVGNAQVLHRHVHAPPCRRQARAAVDAEALVAHASHVEGRRAYVL
eukprot:scaffold442_cov397-Prasinococcus_capsulatus_cf.AAC.33